MKRGLIAWDKTELPPKAFEKRLATARRRLAEQDLPALVVYSDLAQSNLARFYSNFMPYFNRAFLVVPREDKPFLLCGLSPRVYPWIKSVTILEEILHSPNLAQKLLEICVNRGWKRVGMIEPDRLPYDLHSALQGKLEIGKVPHEGDEWELAMHRRAAQMARDGVAAELSTGVGVLDYEFVGRLERRLRRAGAEDLAILLSNGSAAPAAATGQTLQPGYSVCVDLEYRGHWERIVYRHGAEASENQ
jgi:Xaa-Pro aminopeptidase